MSTITKELAKLFRKITNSEIDAEGNAHVVLSPADSLLINNARIALASLEAEPVCVIDQANLDYLKSGSDADVWPASRTEMGDVLLYRAAPPAPVSVPDAYIRDERGRMMLNGRPEPRIGYGGGWNAFRAAMLQGAEPVTTDYKLPANTPCKDAPEHIWLQTAGVWPENGEFSELTWCSDNQHTDDTLYVRADVVPGNSPVIPDGWVMVPEEPTHEMLEAGDEQFGTYDVYRRMLAAAPQQEAKNV